MAFSPDEIHSLLTPSSLAIVGASESSDWAQTIVSNLRSFGYVGKIHMINPHRATAFDQPTWSTISSVPEPVDHAVIITPAGTLLDILEDCRAAGVKGVTVVASGFQEHGSEGIALANRVRSFCDTHRIALVGPNCFGFANFTTGALVIRNGFRKLRAPGGIAVVSQSGGLQLALCNAAEARGVTFAFSISSGNELVVDSNDYYDYLLGRDDVKVIIGTLERIPEPERFREIAERAAELGKPIVMLKLGRSRAAQQLAVAHTGSVAGQDVVVDTFLRDLGIIRVDSIDEAIATADLLDNSGWPKGSRTMFVSFTGGVCGLFADLAQANGIEIPPFDDVLQKELAQITSLSATSVLNPFDSTFEGIPALPEILRQVEASGAYDCVVVATDPFRTPEEHAAFGYIPSTALEVRGRGLYVVAFTPFHRDPTEFAIKTTAGGLSYLNGPIGVLALRNAQRYGSWVSRGADTCPEVDQARQRLVRSLIGADDGALSEHQSKAILVEYGIPVTKDEITHSADAAAAAAVAIGFPVVLKIVSADIPHKSEAGGVILSLESEGAVRRAYDEIVANCRRHDPSATIEGVLVSEMVVGGTEFFVGVTTDPSIGPIVVAGLGGIYVEALNDTVTALPPVSAQRASELLRSLKSASVLAGARGKPPLDLDAFAETVARVSTLAAESRGLIDELDINPLLVLPNGRGVRAVDALVVATKSQSGEHHVAG